MWADFRMFAEDGPEDGAASTIHFRARYQQASSLSSDSWSNKSTIQPPSATSLLPQRNSCILAQNVFSRREYSQGLREGGDSRPTRDVPRRDGCSYLRSYRHRFFYSCSKGGRVARGDYGKDTSFPSLYHFVLQNQDSFF